MSAMLVPGSKGRFTSWALAAAFAVGSVGCNSVTGAGDLNICGVNCDDDEGDSSGSGNGTGSAGGSDGSGTTSATTGTTQCVWPEGNFGTAIGSNVRQNLSWQGYRPGEDVISDISIEEFYDCDGSKGINALLVVTSATWCGNCQAEAQQMSSKTAGSWTDVGIQAITLMIENVEGAPATAETALEWRDSFGLTHSPVVADPAFSFAHNGTIGLPLQIIVDPRTMTIVDSIEGYSGQHTSLESLASQNAAQ
jgi:hypothetical protein